ncbi:MULTISPECIES: MCE family protein [Actinokineospora]|uniref:ABC transporter substrate-binding protein n=1 Tax=Actinokineospora fastidiosa TaxID=1816 RepID=A0A918GPV4_9PSEU|nr:MULTISPECIES: MCE family protein [Actinokineospora]UVS78915.1 virulence factor Mce family protein [Actinokineospora sp. UTMC 2448]GGS48148.1 ABC transporter substrate-binding protein [Actinokineospora fastidiosa]
MKPFRERDTVKVGLVGATVMAVLGLLVFTWESLPIIGGTTYVAHFREAAGLSPDDEVRVAGVKVGKVTDVELENSYVKVSFRSRGVWLGDRTVAAIRIKTLLGQKMLALEPAGGAELDPGTPIPLERTITAYDVTEAFEDLANTVSDIDTESLAESFDTLSETFSATTPQEVRTALEGMSALSRTVATRDEELRKLLEHSAGVGKILAERTDQFNALLDDGAVLLTEFANRREAIGALLRGTRDLSAQLKALVQENQAQIGPALTQLDRVAEVLQRNQANLDKALKLAGPFYRLVGNAVGNGRWIDTYICGLIPAADGTAGCVPPRR